MKTQFLNTCFKQFRAYKNMGDKTLERLDEKQLLYQPDAESNSVALIVKHMHGNMLSRWTDFLTTDGEKEWRKRDEEFEETKYKKEDVIKLWEEGWACTFAAVNSLKEDDLEKKVLIRKEELTVPDALLRQLAHYAYHVGQIVYLGKLQMGDGWESLTIPKRRG